MVAENYGPIFTEIKKDNRQRVLKEQYWFDCTCEACSNDWPTISEMYQEANIRFRCTNKECRSPINVNPHMDSFLVVCTKCSQDNNIVSALKSLKVNLDHFYQQNISCNKQTNNNFIRSLRNTKTSSKVRRHY